MQNTGIFQDKRILILSPHTDDAELGCGGLMGKWDCDVLVFSYCNDHRLYAECSSSLRDRVIGILNYGHRTLLSNRQQILDKLYALRNDYDIVLTPSTYDTHQDHEAVTNEAIRAFDCTILGYELPWNNKKFSADLFVELHPAHLSHKIAMLNEYESQQHRPYFDIEFIKGLARVRGVQAGYGLAEAFEVIRIV